jgi:hypothetical protein
MIKPCVHMHMHSCIYQLPLGGAGCDTVGRVRVRAEKEPSQSQSVNASPSEAGEPVYLSRVDRSKSRSKPKGPQVLEALAMPDRPAGPHWPPWHVRKVAHSEQADAPLPWQAPKHAQA